MITCEEHFACLMLTITRGIISPEHYIKFKCSWESKTVYGFSFLHYIISRGSADVEEQSSLNTYICLSVVLGRRWRVCTVLVSFSIYELIYATTQESRVHRRRTLALRKLLHLWIRRIKGSSLPHQSFSDYSLSPRWDTREIMLREKWLVKVSSIV